MIRTPSVMERTGQEYILIRTRSVFVDGLNFRCQTTVKRTYILLHINRNTQIRDKLVKLFTLLVTKKLSVKKMDINVYPHTPYSPYSLSAELKILKSRCLLYCL